MFGEKQTRTLLEPADPARFIPLPPPRFSAVDLINRAGATAASSRRAMPRRRVLVVVGATAAVAVAAGVAAYPRTGPEPDRQGTVFGPVVVPIAYEIADDPPPAGDPLRDLAASLADAPYDRESRAYAYHRSRAWGTEQSSPEGHVMIFVEEFETWTGADGSVRQRQTVTGVEFPDEESRGYWEAHAGPEILHLPDSSVFDLPPGSMEPMPTGRDELAAYFGITAGQPSLKFVDKLYGDHLVPTEVRAAVLEVLADLPGVAWRGEVTDRAGRPGVAVSYDSQGEDPLGQAYHYREVLVFSRTTGELLSLDLVDLSQQRLMGYSLILEAGWTDDPGPEPTDPTGSSPSPTG